MSNYIAKDGTECYDEETLIEYEKYINVPDYITALDFYLEPIKVSGKLHEAYFIEIKENEGLREYRKSLVDFYAIEIPRKVGKWTRSPYEYWETIEDAQRRYKELKAMAEESLKEIEKVKEIFND